jgi:membrane-associated protease RseP (regulator of RpoE activity)
MTEQEFQKEELEVNEEIQSAEAQKSKFKFLLNLLLLVLTFFTTTIAGVQWIGQDPFDLNNFSYGLPYSLSILLLLGAHELGHYFAARYHKVDATLPYFIPFPPIPQLINFGTIGAVIRTKSIVPSKKAMFDIGAAGPLAGFTVSVGLLIYGFLNIPGPEFIRSIHPNFDFSLGTDPTAQGIPLRFGNTILFQAIQSVFAHPPHGFVPPLDEIYHYPFLCVGWFGLFVTAMNLMPIGQFDGGHIVYTMFGKKHRLIAKMAFSGLILLGLPAVADSFYKFISLVIFNNPNPATLPLTEYSWGGWFLWGIIAYTFVKLYHPPVKDETPLDETRKLVGWFCLLILIVSFSYLPFAIIF